jgi:cytochrome P450 family 6
VKVENMNQLKYLEAVFKETARLRPAVAHNIRRCTKDYTIPGTNILIPKGMRVFMPASGKIT